MNNKKINFAKNLRTLRTLRGMTQQELADKIHITRQTLSTWERGAGKPDIYSVSDLCELFDVTPTQILYEHIIKEKQDHLTQTDITVKEEYSKNYTYEVIDIMDEDLQDMYDFLQFDLVKILVIALELHRRHYNVVEIFDSGFSVLVKSIDGSVRLNLEVMDIIESIIHGDNTFINDKYTDISDKYDEAKSEMIENAMKEILGDYLSNYKYYWIDEMENVRGYANSEEECMEQAKKQLCTWYRVMKKV